MLTRYDAKRIVGSSNQNWMCPMPLLRSIAATVGELACIGAFASAVALWSMGA